MKRRRRRSRRNAGVTFWTVALAGAAAYFGYQYATNIAASKTAPTAGIADTYRSAANSYLLSAGVVAVGAYMDYKKGYLS